MGNREQKAMEALAESISSIRNISQDGEEEVFILTKKELVELAKKVAQAQFDKMRKSK